MKSLSWAARLLLIQSTLMAIPIYTMQTLALPTAIRKEVEQVCRWFFWGESVGERRMHTVYWDKICTPKTDGGLGLPRLIDTNWALLAKLCWRFLANSGTISSLVVRCKYGGWDGLCNPKPYQIISSTCRGLL